MLGLRCDIWPPAHTQACKVAEDGGDSPGNHSRQMQTELRTHFPFIEEGMGGASEPAGFGQEPSIDEFPDDDLFDDEMDWEAAVDEVAPPPKHRAASRVRTSVCALL